MALPVPLQVLRRRTDTGVPVENERFSIGRGKTPALGRRFRESVATHVNEEVVAIYHGCPQALVKHPMGIRSKSQTIAGVVISRDGMLMKAALSETPG